MGIITRERGGEHEGHLIRVSIGSSAHEGGRRRHCLRAALTGVLVALGPLGGCRTSGTLSDSASDASPTREDPAASADADAESTDAGALDAPDDTPSTVDRIAADAGRPARVLFVGNSYTYFNDLPAVVRALGDATHGAAVEVDSVVMGGATLASHWAFTGARERIATGGFDAVVLQGQSAETLTDPTGFASFAGLLAGVVRDAGARTVWFATWSIRPDPRNPTEVAGAVTATRSIERGYQDAARVNGGVVARVGAAFQLARAELPDVALQADDRSHPSPAGTLLAACVIHQAITGQAPRVPDPPPLGLSRATAAALCALAPRVRCNEGMGRCEGACVEMQSSPINCGACGVECSGMDPCVQGRCGCPAGRTPCARTACVDLLTDTANCGACGNRCPTGGVCERGGCSCPSGAVYRVSYPALSALHRGCTSFTEGSIADCDAAAHRYCGAMGCFNSGLGPTLVPGRGLSVLCFRGDVRTTSYEALRALVPACDGFDVRTGPSCSTAVSRFCASVGAVSGFGPVETAGDALTVTCLPRATVVHTTFAALAAAFSPCDGVTERGGLACRNASSFLCASMGHVAGVGPVEAFESTADVVCVDP